MPEIYRFAGLELDTARFQVRRDGQVLPVQPQVFDVLRYLLENRDRVVSKDELLDKVWADRVVSETTLSSRIKTVRSLVGDSGDRQELIRTIRNRGFRFVGDVETRLTSAASITRTATAARGSGITSIAVLPFETYAAERRDDYLGQGLAADIIALLASHHRLRVISRGSSFAYSQAEHSLKEIGAALDVRYVLMGRIRPGGGTLRIDAELADTRTGAHLWSQRYDADEADIFAVQEDISRHIAAAIEPELQLIEAGRAAARSGDPDAWSACYKGLLHLYRFRPDDLEVARARFRDALGIEPELAYAHAGLAYTGVQLAFYGPHAERAAELALALEHSQRAVELDDRDAFNHFVRGRALSLSLRFEEAERALEHAIGLSRSFAQAYFALGFSYTNSGRPAAAIELFETAVSLSPRDPHLWTFHHLRAMAHFRLDELADAERYIRLAVAQPNATYWPFATLTALLADAGRTDEAAAIADRLVRMKPGYSVAFAEDDFFFTPRDEFVERYLAALAAAGVPQR
ncbi:MAG: winged helix-turn-helix domain-containing protein [Woeseiaceae bacterium]|nr:winged helix-turn-helix domain-containing protein [Woeseiaceae bacterium]